MLLKIIWLLLNFIMGLRAGIKLDENFKELKWYDKIIIVYWWICIVIWLIINLISIWNWF